MHGSEVADADVIVGSSPCQEYSYMAMPWSLAKDKAAAIRADETGELLRQLNELFDAQFRIQREASEAAGRYIPLVVENVRGAQPWVGRAAWNYGSFYLWGDIPALMPNTVGGRKGGGDWFGAGQDCSLQRRASSGSSARKAASALIAKIPFALSSHIARVYKP